MVGIASSYTSDLANTSTDQNQNIANLIQIRLLPIPGRVQRLHAAVV